MPRKINIVYHQDSGFWWANSPDLERYIAGREMLEDLRHMIHTELSEFLGEELVIVETLSPYQIPDEMTKDIPLKRLKKHSSRAMRRHHSDRIIEKRMRLIKEIWHSGYSPAKGKLRKWNMSCNCHLCKWDKKMGVESIKEKVCRDRLKQGLNIE